MRAYAISHILAALILIVIVVTAAVLLYVFGMGVLGTLGSTYATQISIAITPYIYDPNSNIGYLNEQANFTIAIWNPLNSTLPATVKVTTGSSIIQNIEFEARPRATTIFITQELSTTGTWTVLVIVQGPQGPVTYSYSFDVKTNQDDAKLAVNQLANSRIRSDLEIGTLVIAALGVILAVIKRRNLTASRKQRRKT
jgi:hypothetical protein